MFTEDGEIRSIGPDVEAGRSEELIGRNTQMGMNREKEAGFVAAAQRVHVLQKGQRDDERFAVNQTASKDQARLRNASLQGHHPPLELIRSVEAIPVACQR